MTSMRKPELYVKHDAFAHRQNMLHENASAVRDYQKATRMIDQTLSGWLLPPATGASTQSPQVKAQMPVEHSISGGAESDSNNSVTRKNAKDMEKQYDVLGQASSIAPQTVPKAVLSSRLVEGTETKASSAASPAVAKGGQDPTMSVRAEKASPGAPNPGGAVNPKLSVKHNKHPSVQTPPNSYGRGPVLSPAPASPPAKAQIPNLPSGAAVPPAVVLTPKQAPPSLLTKRPPRLVSPPPTPWRETGVLDVVTKPYNDALEKARAEGPRVLPLGPTWIDGTQSALRRLALEHQTRGVR